MTKEEYEKLLSSDYWKGYSYSLIKERDFTCEDCGRRFFNERHKLQVHHLVYRDVNPWSYKPEEVVVLCRECHERRHGIIPKSEAPSPSYGSGTYSKSYTSSTENAYDKSYSSTPHTSTAESDTATKTGSDIESQPYNNHPNTSGFKFKYVLWGCVALFVFMIGRNLFSHKQNEIDVEQEDSPIETVFQTKEIPYSAHKEKSSSLKSNDIEEELLVVEDVSEVASQNTEEPVASVPVKEEKVEAPVQEKKGKSTLELLEERNHADAVRRAQRAGVSPEGTTMEILERINHADVVKRAQRAGVSTEGSTMDVLERINHADVVKRAQRAGVSTEGSTMDILERINHVDVVKRAQRLGVSTEGSTMDILERINRKELERYQ